MKKLLSKNKQFMKNSSSLQNTVTHKDVMFMYLLFIILRPVQQLSVLYKTISTAFLKGKHLKEKKILKVHQSINCFKKIVDLLFFYFVQNNLLIVVLNSRTALLCRRLFHYLYCTSNGCEMLFLCVYSDYKL